jgi:hypothetical protein
MSTRTLQLSTYTWQLDYRQDFSRYAAASMSLINEGHIVGHHRDGTAFEAWARLPLFKDRLAIAAGYGLYAYFDTQPLGNGDTADVHGRAPIYSVSLNYYLGHRMYLFGVANRIAPHNDVKTNTVAAGFGVWLGQDDKPKRGELGAAPGETGLTTPNEITVFAGQSIVNTLFSEHALAYAGEYRRGLIKHIDWTASAIYEGDPKVIRRSGVATQLWAVNSFFNERMSVGAGIGPYIFIDRRHPTPHTLRSPAAAAPLVSLTVATKLDDHWLARLIFNRVASNYNRDSDIILVGLGYRWGAN